MDLIAELKKCTGGETIDLTDIALPKTVLKGFHFAKPVTLLRGTIDGLQMSDCSGLAFVATALVARAEVDPYYPNRISNCADITMTDIELAGDIAVPVPEQTSPGLFLDGCQRVTILRPEAHHLKHGIAHRGCDTLRIAEGSFHDIRTDGIRGTGSSNVEITDNLLRDFTPAAGDHPDAIQLWTMAGSRSRNILIARNVIDRGNGAAMQGILCSDTDGSFEDLRIIDNDLTGSMWIGISVYSASGEIRGNTLRSLPGYDSRLTAERFIGPIEGNTAPKLMGQVSAELNTLGNAPPRVIEPAPEPEATPTPPPTEPEAEGVLAEVLTRLDKAEVDLRETRNAASRGLYAIERAREAVKAP